MLNIQHLQVQHFRHTVFRDLTLQVEETQCMAICGDHDSGNTELLQCLMNTRSYSGSITWKDAPLSLHDVAYASKNPIVLRRQRVLEYGRYLQVFYPDFSMREYHGLTQQAELDDKRYIAALSERERRLLDVFSAFTTHCELILLDDPLFEEPVKKQAIWWERIRELTTPTILMITEGTKGIQAFADQILYMEKGKLTETKTMIQAEETTSDVQEDKEEKPQKSTEKRKRMFEAEGWDDDETDW